MLQVHIGKEMYLFKTDQFNSFCLSRKTFACICLLYYKNVDFQDTGDIHSTPKFKQMTSLELNADCGLKYISAWSLHSSLHIYLPQQNDSTVRSLANALNHWNIILCDLLFRMATSQIPILNCLNVCCSNNRIRSDLKRLQQSSLQYLGMLQISKFCMFKSKI